MTATMTGPEYDLLVVRTVRDRILAGDWSARGPRDTHGRRCLAVQLLRGSETAYAATLHVVMASEGPQCSVGEFNDRSTQAEVIALLDDVEDSLLGEMGVVS